MEEKVSFRSFMPWHATRIPYMHCLCSFLLCVYFPHQKHQNEVYLYPTAYETLFCSKSDLRHFMFKHLYLWPVGWELFVHCSPCHALTACYFATKYGRVSPTGSHGERHNLCSGVVSLELSNPDPDSRSLLSIPLCPGSLRCAPMGGHGPTSHSSPLHRQLLRLHRGSSASRFVASSGECALS